MRDVPVSGQLKDLVPPELAALAAAIDDLGPVPLDRSILTGLLMASDRLAAKTSTVIAEYDDAKLWDNDGASSMFAWLKDAGAMTNGDASRSVRTARRMAQCPVTKAAWDDGVLSGGQVAAIVANVDDRTIGLFQEAEARLVAKLAPLSTADTVRAMNYWSTKAKAIADEKDPPEPPANTVHLSSTLDGRAEMSASLDAQANAIIDAALQEAMPPRDRDNPMALSERRAIALIDIMNDFLNTHQAPKGRRNRPHLNIITTLEDLRDGGPGVTTDGIVLDGSIIRSMACDAVIHRVLVDQNGTVLDLGLGTRTVTASQFTALAIRDKGCRWPGCDRIAKYTEAHHLHWWRRGGKTDMANLGLFCSHHHHLIHKGEWDVVLDTTTNVMCFTKPGEPPMYSHPRAGPPLIAA